MSSQYGELWPTNMLTWFLGSTPRSFFSGMWNFNVWLVDCREVALEALWGMLYAHFYTSHYWYNSSSLHTTHWNI